MANTQKKSWEMIVNPNVDVCIKLMITGKHSANLNAKAKQLLKTKYQNISYVGVQFLHSLCQGSICITALLSVTPLTTARHSGSEN